MIGKIFIVSAPCGAGKSSLVAAVLEELQRDWQIYSVATYTTRKPRQNEHNGRDYHFIDLSEFEQRIQDNFFLEWSNVYGAYYGSPYSVVTAREKGMSFILILDRAGAQQVIQKVPNVVLIWIEVPSMASLKKRLLARGTEDNGQIERRLERSKIEIELELQAPLYPYKVMNDDFGTAKMQLMTIIMSELTKNCSKAMNGVQQEKTLD